MLPNISKNKGSFPRHLRAMVGPPCPMPLVLLLHFPNGKPITIMECLLCYVSLVVYALSLILTLGLGFHHLKHCPDHFLSNSNSSPWIIGFIIFLEVGTFQKMNVSMHSTIAFLFLMDRPKLLVWMRSTTYSLGKALSLQGAELSWALSFILPFGEAVPV